MSKKSVDNIRNVAIIAHVDHGKTTLVDSMFRQSGIFRSNEQVRERVLDSNDIERERGITILSKNASVTYGDVKINIVDTPGHADFGGEVERVLKMVDGVLLLVDSFEGPMPQTRFVLRKALDLSLVPIVVVNKADRPDSRLAEVVDEILNLFIELGADDSQLEFPIIYASAKDGWAIYDDILTGSSGIASGPADNSGGGSDGDGSSGIASGHADKSGGGSDGDGDGDGSGIASSPVDSSGGGSDGDGDGGSASGPADSSGSSIGSSSSSASGPADNISSDLAPLFTAIIDTVPPPSGYPDMPLQILVSNIDYDEYVGRIAIGRIERGSASKARPVTVCGKSNHNEKIMKLYAFEGIKRTEIESAGLGDIVAVAGLGDVDIGDTVCDVSAPEPLPFINIDEPTIAMTFSVNNSPLAGREGSYVTSRHLRDRLFREIETNVSMRVEETGSTDAFLVSGRGELHLSILIETMRRQGYEFSVSKPNAITHMIDGVEYEPIEHLTIDVPDEFIGIAIEKLGARKAEMINMRQSAGGSTRIEFHIPARGLIGFRSEFLTDTKGNGIMNHVFHGFGPHKGEIASRTRGSLIAWEDGEAVAYGLYNAQDRGALFIAPGERVYEGMIVGECSREEDMVINVCKKKHITNIRAAGSDEAIRLTPPRLLSLEQALEFIADDELIEVTPKKMRMRKRILNAEQRIKARNRASDPPS